VQRTFNPPIQTAPPSTQVLRGHVADRFERRALRVSWNGARLEGRIGGWWFPQTFALERSQSGLIGRSGALAINITHGNGLLEVLVGGAGYSERVTLELATMTGWLERGETREPVRVQNHDASSVTVGTHSASLEPTDAPGWIALSAVLVAVITERELSRTLLESLRDLRDS
jgi:hypothetical protein